MTHDRLSPVIQMRKVDKNQVMQGLECQYKGSGWTRKTKGFGNLRFKSHL